MAESEEILNEYQSKLRKSNSKLKKLKKKLTKISVLCIILAVLFVASLAFALYEAVQLGKTDEIVASKVSSYESQRDQYKDLYDKFTTEAVAEIDKLEDKIEKLEDEVAQKDTIVESYNRLKEEYDRLKNGSDQ